MLRSVSRHRLRTGRSFPTSLRRCTSPPKNPTSH